MDSRQSKIRERIIAAMVEEDYPERDAVEFAFHMTDWISDFDSLIRFYEEPTKLTDAEINSLMLKFLTHVKYHVDAAALILFGDDD